MLQMKRKLRTRLDLLKPSVWRHVENKQNSSVERSASRSLRQFQKGDTVMVRNYGTGNKWLPGKISEVLGTRNYMVGTGGQLWKRHVDQLLNNWKHKQVFIKMLIWAILRPKSIKKWLQYLKLLTCQRMILRQRHPRLLLHQARRQKRSIRQVLDTA